MSSLHRPEPSTEEEAAAVESKRNSIMEALMWKSRRNPTRYNSLVSELAQLVKIAETETEHTEEDGETGVRSGSMAEKASKNLKEWLYALSQCVSILGSDCGSIVNTAISLSTKKWDIFIKAMGDPLLGRGGGLVTQAEAEAEAQHRSQGQGQGVKAKATAKAATATNTQSEVEPAAGIQPASVSTSNPSYALLHFIHNLVATQNHFVLPCLDKLVSNFRLAQPGGGSGGWVPDLDRELNGEVLENTSDDVQNRLVLPHFTHYCLYDILRLVPASSTLLLKTLGRQFPHRRFGTLQHETYVANCLAITTYAPALLDGIIDMVIGKLVPLSAELEAEEEAEAAGGGAVTGIGAGSGAAGKDMPMWGDGHRGEGDSDSDSDSYGDMRSEVDGIFDMDDEPESREDGDGDAFDDEEEEEEEEDEHSPNSTAHKLDSIMCLLFAKLDQWVKASQIAQSLPQPQPHFVPVALDSVFMFLQNAFDKHILRAHSPKCLQFLMFRACSFDYTRYPDAFLKYLLDHLRAWPSDPTVSQTSSFYIASFVARAPFITPLAARSALDFLIMFAHDYLDVYEAADTRHTAVGMIASGSGGRGRGRGRVQGQGPASGGQGEGGNQGIVTSASMTALSQFAAMNVSPAPVPAPPMPAPAPSTGKRRRDGGSGGGGGSGGIASDGTAFPLGASTSGLGIPPHTPTRARRDGGGAGAGVGLGQVLDMNGSGSGSGSASVNRTVAEQSFVPAVKKHAPFYAACQSFFYAFCFAFKTLVDLPHGGEHFAKWGLERILLSRLNPLMACSSSIVSEFTELARSMNVIDCGVVLRRNRALRSEIRSAANGSKSKSAAAATLEILTPFFPFDPYPLIESSDYITNLYREWNDDSVKASNASFLRSMFGEGTLNADGSLPASHASQSQSLSLASHATFMTSSPMPMPMPGSGHAHMQGRSPSVRMGGAGAGAGSGIVGSLSSPLMVGLGVSFDGGRASFAGLEDGVQIGMGIGGSQAARGIPLPSHGDEDEDEDISFLVGSAGRMSFTPDVERDIVWHEHFTDMGGGGGRMRSGSSKNRPTREGGA